MQFLDCKKLGAPRIEDAAINKVRTMKRCKLEKSPKQFCKQVVTKSLKPLAFNSNRSIASYMPHSRAVETCQ